MVIKLANITDWVPVEKGKVVVLHSRERGQSRKIRLEVNSSWPVRVTRVSPDADPFHLAVVDGFQVIEFYDRGTVEVAFESALAGTEDVEAWVYSAEGQKVSTAVPDSKTFTRIANRRARNPELEWMQFKMMENMERRLAQERAEIARLYGADQQTGEISDDGPETDGEAATGSPAGNAGDVPESGQVEPAPEPVVEPDTQTAEAPKTATK